MMCSCKYLLSQSSSPAARGVKKKALLGSFCTGLSAEGLGSVTTITDAGMNVAQSYTYDSFGMPKPSANFYNSYLYSGREWDRETGLYFYRARYYDPMDGRFITKDPIGFDRSEERR